MEICSNKTNYNMKKINSSLIVEKLNNPSFSNLTNPSTKIIDMHTHTNYSDGVLSPQELIALAIAKNIGTIEHFHRKIKCINNIRLGKWY